MTDKPLDKWTIQDVDNFVDKLLKPVPGLLRGSIAKPLKEACHEDRDKNGKVDVLEWLVKAKEAGDLLNELNEQIDFVALANFADDLPFIKDKVAFKATMHRMAEKIETAQKLAEAQKLLESQNK